MRGLVWRGGKHHGGGYGAFHRFVARSVGESSPSLLRQVPLFPQRQQEATGYPDVRCFAKPRKKLPGRSVDVYCKNCGTMLYKYRKGGKGALVKCFVERITMDFTEQPCICPGCSAQFARETMIRGAPAYKMIGGKVFMK
ncbi:hypothetical protein HOP50_02g10670 [Chloropicon primus]|uniref:Uncharacterized protein n=1 Tax=Chloropicon primus TaxID=1764295 RepID=A0A5B8MDQ1_9CHLO|nr:hypothetical protein A3770_02p10810 [Chloropicon primus]UPQ97772.1 hypothetical protein HOP50_02g10670 [Chloropicon primus]|mmetsp:Transcript_7776/g.22209  ORF Transcript_7776/g.22209 Transcript_7776/m.22209 type:complete len:140 (+) Transcript_7776:3112-3531(+)|eukprot:QDZ18563.1 hypothetical protein A3770_02p10810 [Chloropicon primus]